MLTNVKGKIDSRLQRIANILLLNGSFTDNLGLLNGKMGIAIFFYHYYRYTNNKVYEEYAGELIDEIYNEINKNTPVSFADGLTGIGWGIEYLARSNFVQADTDEALSEIDSSINRVRLKPSPNDNNHDNFFGYAHYYISRLNEPGIGKDKIKFFIRKYKLGLLIDEYEKFLLELQSNNSINDLDLEQLNSFIWFLLEVQHLKIFPVKSRKILNGVSEVIEKIPFNLQYLADLELLNELLKRNRVHFSGKSKYEKYFETWKNKNTVTDDKAENLIRLTCQKIIYGDYCRNIVLNFPIAELLDQDNEDDYWNKLLDNIKKDKLSLIGIAGLGLGLINYTKN